MDHQRGNFFGDIWDGDAEDLCQRLIGAAEAAIPYLTSQSRELSQAAGRWVLESERVHPTLVERLTRAGTARGVFVVETDARRLWQTLTERLPGFGSLSARAGANGSRGRPALQCVAYRRDRSEGYFVHCVTTMGVTCGPTARAGVVDSGAFGRLSSVVGDQRQAKNSAPLD